MSKRIKLSGAQFKKQRIKREFVTNQSKEFMKNFIKSNLSPSSEGQNNNSPVSESYKANPNTNDTAEDMTDGENQVIITTSMIHTLKKVCLQLTNNLICHIVSELTIYYIISSTTQ